MRRRQTVGKASGHDGEHRLQEEPRYQDEAGLLGVETPVVLQVEAHEEGHGEGGAVVDEGGDVREGEDPVAQEEVDAEHGVGRPRLAPEEQRQPGHARHDEDRPASAPGRYENPSSRAESASAQTTEPEHVEARRLGLAPLDLAELPERRDAVEQAQCPHDQKQDPPSGVAGDDAAQHRAERSSPGRRRLPVCRGPVLGSREDGRASPWRWLVANSRAAKPDPGARA